MLWRSPASIELQLRIVVDVGSICIYDRLRFRDVPVADMSLRPIRPADTLGTPTAFGPILTLFYSTKFAPSQLFYSILVGHSLKDAIFLCYAFFGLELRPHLISPSATQQRSVN
jgi:hypothetical protein